MPQELKSIDQVGLTKLIRELVKKPAFGKYYFGLMVLALNHVIFV